MIQGLFLYGFMAGSVLGIPIGPNGTLCLYRSLRFGWHQGMATACGSVTAMFAHAFVSFMLLAQLMEIVSLHAGSGFIDRLSGAVSVVIGIVFYLASGNRKADEEVTEQQGVFLVNFLSAFTIGIVNPKNIFGFAAMLVAGNIDLAGGEPSITRAAAFGGGVFLSTSLLFALLIFLSVTIGERFLSRVIPRLRYVVPAVFIATGVLKLARAI